MKAAECSLSLGIGRNYETLRHLVWSIRDKKENLKSAIQKMPESKVWSISEQKDMCGINVNINYPKRN